MFENSGLTTLTYVEDTFLRFLVNRLRQTDAARENVPGIESGGHTYQLRKTSNHQSGAHEQNQTQSNFGNDKRITP